MTKAQIYEKLCVAYDKVPETLSKELGITVWDGYRFIADVGELIEELGEDVQKSMDRKP